MFLNWMSGKIRESPLDCKEIKTVNPKGNQSWIFFGRTILKLKVQYFGHLMRRVDSLEKTDAWRDWGQEEKGTTEDGMAGWHHQLINGHEFGQALGDAEEQGSLACCNPWGHKKLDMTEWLNWTELMIICWVLPCRRFFIFIFSFMPLDFKSKPFPIPELWRSSVTEECFRVFF